MTNPLGCSVGHPDLPHHSDGLVSSLRRLWASWIRTGLRRRGHDQQRQMYVIETLALAPHKACVLFHCAGERFLAGTGKDGVTTLLRVGPDSVERRTDTQMGRD